MTAIKEPEKVLVVDRKVLFGENNESAFQGFLPIGESHKLFPSVRKKRGGK